MIHIMHTWIINSPVHASRQLDCVNIVFDQTQDDILGLVRAGAGLWHVWSDNLLRCSGPCHGGSLQRER